MSRRNLALHAVGKTYSLVLDEPERAHEHVRALLIEMLPPQQKQVYAFCCGADQPVTSRDIENLLSASSTYASSLLKELWEVGLLDRAEVVNDKTRYFEYKLSRQKVNDAYI